MKSIIQVKEQDTGKDRERKINDLARLFDNRIRKTEKEITDLSGSINELQAYDIDKIIADVNKLHKTTVNIGAIGLWSVDNPANYIYPTNPAHNVSLNGNQLQIDADRDTYLHSTADDIVQLVLAGAAGQFDVSINGAEDFRFTANTFTGLAGSSMVMDTLTVATGSITDSTGAISFGNENLSTTGWAAASHVDIDDYLNHAGDANTYLLFQPDRGMFYIGGKYLLDMNTVAVQDYVKIGDGSDVDINLNDDLTIDGASGAVTIVNLGLGVVHASAAGLLTSSAIVAADITNNVISNTQLANLGTAGTLAKFGATGLADSVLTENAGNIINGTGYFDSKNFYYINGVKFINPDANGNIGIGTRANNSVITADSNVSIGLDANRLNTAGKSNVSIGVNAHKYGLGDFNVSLGTYANGLANNVTADHNMAIGYSALYNNLAGDSNTGIGSSVLYDCLGNANTGIGKESLRHTVGHSNTGIGNLALWTTTGSYNTGVGDRAGYKTTGLSGVFIGNLAGYWETAGSKLFIDNTDRGSEANGRIKALIYGIFDALPANQLLRVNGNIEIAQNSLGLKLGAAQDSSIIYDGTNMVFRTLIGTANYIFDGYTTVDTDTTVKIIGGEAKDAIFDLICDEGDDAADKFRLRTVYNATSADNLLKIQCDSAVKDTFVDKFIMTTDGKLGVGPTPAAPTYQLEVTNNSVGGTQGYVTNTNNDASSYAGWYAKSDGTGAMAIGSASSNQAAPYTARGYIHNTNPGMLIEQAGNYPIDFYTNATKRMTIAGTGTVTLDAYGAGIIHSSAVGLLTSSAIVGADLGNLGGTTGKIPKFATNGLADSLLSESGSIVTLPGTFDISYGGDCLKLGADSGASTRTNATTKVGKIVGANYTNAGSNIELLKYSSEGTSTTKLYISDDAVCTDTYIQQSAVHINNNIGNAIVGIGTAAEANVGLAIRRSGGSPAGQYGAIISLQNSDTEILSGHDLGSIQFSAPLEASGGDAILIAAQITAEAEGTFSATNNATSLLFKTGASEAAATKAILTSAGKLGIGPTPAAPTYDFEVTNNHVGGTSCYVTNTNNDASSYAGWYAKSDGTGAMAIGSASSNQAAPYTARGYIYNTNPGMLIEQAGNYPIDFYTNTTKRMTIAGTGIVSLDNTPNYANDAAAKAGGLVNQDVYRNGDVLMICHA